MDGITKRLKSKETRLSLSSDRSHKSNLYVPAELTKIAGKLLTCFPAKKLAKLQCLEFKFFIGCNNPYDWEFALTNRGNSNRSQGWDCVEDCWLFLAAALLSQLAGGALRCLPEICQIYLGM